MAQLFLPVPPSCSLSYFSCSYKGAWHRQVYGIPCPDWEPGASSPELCAKQVCEVCKGCVCETDSDPCLLNEELPSTSGAVSSVSPFPTVFARPPSPSSSEA